MQNSKGNSEIGEKHKISDGMPHLQDLIKKFEAFHKKTQNEIDNAAIALVDNHVHFNNNGYGKTHASASNIRYASFTSNGYVQDYANSTHNFRDLYDWPINGGYNNDNAFATNNGYKYNTDCTYSNGFVSRAQPKVYLPLVDSSIVSMVPPPSFLKGIGNF
ncbi:hypothetical protein, partial [Flavobacterium poyangense]|uniref:hypothetical protein n=1 Tax=Flavobacterium poyangense TaxID=2204302 RepID=UPI001AB060DE